MQFPSWWSDGVRVVNGAGQSGVIGRAGNDGWVIQLDGEKGGDSSYIANPEAGAWSAEVRQGVTRSQAGRVAHDAERALLRSFGCHYVPEWEALPDSVRAGKAPRPTAVGRPELDGLRAIVRAAVSSALLPYVQD